MIIIQDKNIENLIYFPKNIYNESSDIYNLILIDRGTNKEYKFNVEDTLGATYGFYTFNINFSELPDGEYEYTILGIGEKIIPESDYEITYNKYINTQTENITSSQYLDIYRYILNDDYNEYDFYITARARRADPFSYLINYFDENNNLIGKDLPLPGTYENESFLIPNRTKEIYFSHPAPLTLLDTFKVLMKRKKSPTIFSKGLIRINELKNNSINYNDNRTYIAYDKQ